MNLSNEKLNKIMKVLLIVSLCLISVYILSQFSGLLNNIKNAFTAVLTPFLIAFFISFLIYPLVIYAEDKGLRPRWVIVTFLYIFIFGLIGVILWQVIPLIATQLNNLFFHKIPEIYNKFNSNIKNLHIADNPTLSKIYNQTSEQLQKYVSGATVSALSSVKSIVSLMFTLILSPIILFYLLKDHDQIGEGFYRIVPEKYKEHFIELTKRINETLGLYIRGQVIIMFGIAVISTLGYTLIGLDNAIIFGIIVGLTNIIPYIGATIAAIVPIVYAVLTGDVPWYYILFLNVGFQFVEGNILQPVIMSKQLDIHPLIILAAILGFGSLFGVIGVILAVPVIGLVKVCILYFREVKEQKEIEELEGYEV